MTPPNPGEPACATLRCRFASARAVVREKPAMFTRTSTVLFVLAAALGATTGSAGAADDGKYPNWKGQWARFITRGLPGQASHDQTKPWGYGQEAPLTPQYQKVLE